MLTLVYIALALSLAVLLVNVCIMVVTVGPYVAAQILVAIFFFIILCAALAVGAAYIWEKLDS